MTSTSPESQSINQQVKGEIDTLVKKDVDSVDSSVRYAAYGARLRTALRASSRYIAYVSGRRRFFFRTFARWSSHVRPATLGKRSVQSCPPGSSPPHTAFPGSTWPGKHNHMRPHRVKLELYPLHSDIGYEGYKAYQKGPSPVEAANFSESTRIGMLVVKRAVFQSVASM